MNFDKEALISYALHNLLQIKNAAIIGVILSLPSTILSNITNWYIENNTYISIVLGVIAIDHIFGSVVHIWYKKDASLKKNIAGLIIKLSVVVCVGFMFEGLAHLTKEEDFFYKYLKMTLRILILSYPLRSALANCKIITKGAFPPESITKRLDNFNKNLDTKELVGRKELEDNPAN